MDLQLVRKKEIKAKPKMAAAKKWECSDEIYCNEDIVRYQNISAKTVTAKDICYFQIKTMRSRTEKGKNGDEHRRTEKP